MLADLRAVSLGRRPRPPRASQLNGWLNDCKTGQTRLRAGLPAGWPVGDKTGTGANGAANDIAIAWAPAADPDRLLPERRDRVTPAARDAPSPRWPASSSRPSAGALHG